MWIVFQMTVFFKKYVMFLSKKQVSHRLTGEKRSPNQLWTYTKNKKYFSFKKEVCSLRLLFLPFFSRGERYLCSKSVILYLWSIPFLSSEAHQILYRPYISFSYIIRRLEKFVRKFVTKSLSFPISMVLNWCSLLAFLASVPLDWISPNHTPSSLLPFLLTASPTLELSPAGSPGQLVSSSGSPKPRDC